MRIISPLTPMPPEQEPDIGPKGTAALAEIATYAIELGNLPPCNNRTEILQAIASMDEHAAAQPNTMHAQWNRDIIHDHRNRAQSLDDPSRSVLIQELDHILHTLDMQLLERQNHVRMADFNLKLCIEHLQNPDFDRVDASFNVHTYSQLLHRTLSYLEAKTIGIVTDPDEQLPVITRQLDTYQQMAMSIITASEHYYRPNLITRDTSQLPIVRSKLEQHTMKFYIGHLCCLFTNIHNTASGIYPDTDMCKLRTHFLAMQQLMDIMPRMNIKTNGFQALLDGLRYDKLSRAIHHLETHLDQADIQLVTMLVDECKSINDPQLKLRLATIQQRYTTMTSIIKSLSITPDH